MADVVRFGALEAAGEDGDERLDALDVVDVALSEPQILVGVLAPSPGGVMSQSGPEVGVCQGLFDHI